MTRLPNNLQVREIEDLLEGGGRVVWSGSHSAMKKYFDFDDIQHLKGVKPYQSSKFATDLISVALNRKLNEKGIYSFDAAPGMVLSALSYMVIPAFLWLFVIPIMVLVGPLLLLSLFFFPHQNSSSTVPTLYSLTVY